MKAAVYYENGGPDVFKYEDVPDPECHRKGIIIRVEAVSIEGGDTLNRFRGALMTKPHVVGYQAAGEVVAVGDEVEGIKVGDKVVTTGAFGSHAELREVARLTDKHMADVIVDSVGGPTLQSSILSLAYRGRVSMVGQAGREPMKVDVGTMMGGNRSLSGVFLGAEIATDRVHDNIQQLIRDVADGSLKVVIDRTFPLKDAADAHRYIESRLAVGRVLLIP